VLAGIASLTIVAAALVGWRQARWVPWVRWPPIIAIAFLVAVIILGAMVVLRGLGPGLAALDLGSALAVLTLMITSTIVAFHHYDPDHPIRLTFRSPFARLTLATMVTTFVVFVSGVLVAHSGSVVRCLSWPLYGASWAPEDARTWIQLVRGLVSGLGVLLIVFVVVQALGQKSHHTRPVRWTAALTGMLLLVELLLGASRQMLGDSPWLQVTYVAVASALWATVVALAVLAGLERSHKA
jgi:heme A synthase